jgi:hypothetical protein
MDKPPTNVQSCILYLTSVVSIHSEFGSAQNKSLGERDCITEAYKYFPER